MEKTTYLDFFRQSPGGYGELESYGDFDVLNTLRRRNDPAGTNPRDLAETSLITSGAMTTRLDRLERSGFVRRGPDPADRRAVLITLTPSGERLARKALIGLSRDLGFP